MRTRCLFKSSTRAIELHPRSFPVDRELVAIMKDPAMIAWMQERGAEAVSSTPDEFSAYIRRDLSKWDRVVKDIGLIPE